MKKILTSLLLMTMALSFAGVSLHANTNQDTYDVTLTTMFDEDNGGIETDFKDKTYGEKIHLDDSFGDTSDHAFAFWVVNGAVRKDLPADHEFVVTDAMDIQAVFSPTSSHEDGLKHASLFMDSNGQLIDTQYLSDGGDALDPTEQESENEKIFKETFANLDIPSGYEDGTFESFDNTFTWSYYQAMDYPTIEEESIRLDESSANARLEATIPTGITSFSVDFMKPYSGDAKIEVRIDDQTFTSHSITSTDEVDTFTIKADELNAIEGSFDLEILSADAQVVLDNIEWETPATSELPDKPGYNINETTPWDKNLTNIQENSVFILQYEKDTSETFNLTVEDGSGAGTYDYNEVATVSPDSAPSGESFSHWEVDGEIVSYQDDYNFTMLNDKSVSAIFQETPKSEEPLVTLSDDLALRTGYASYLGQFEYSGDDTLIDYGIIASDEDAPIELEDEGITKYTGSKYSGETNEFLMSLSKSHATLRAFLTLKDSSGTLSTHYSPYDIPADANYENMTLDELTAIDLDPMYDSAEGLYGDDLRTELQSIIADIEYESYGEARYILDETDQDPDIDSNLILIYTRDSVSGEWDAGATWNREHVWPQSLLDVETNNSSKHEGSDLHNLAPADPGENSSRSNQHFTSDGSGYDPHDEVKGDVARMLFYMDTMYSELSLVDGAPSTYKMGDLDELLQWHVDDAVNAFENNRNNIIENYQNNRNPFIDHPHLAYLIFYDHPQVDLEE